MEGHKYCFLELTRKSESAMKPIPFTSGNGVCCR
jgi:hypothetical protein